MVLRKGKVLKFLIILFLFLAVIGPLVFAVVKYSNNYDFTIVNYEMDAVIDDNGDMHVIEKVTNKYKNENTVFYKNLIWYNFNVLKERIYDYI